MEIFKCVGIHCIQFMEEKKMLTNLKTSMRKISNSDLHKSYEKRHIMQIETKFSHDEICMCKLKKKLIKPGI